MALSNRTIGFFADCFAGGAGLSLSTIDRVWVAADAPEYYARVGGNKADCVLWGLKYLRDGAPGDDTYPALPPDHDKLLLVASDLAERLLARDFIDRDRLDAALARDGLALGDDTLVPIKPQDEPADRLADYVERLLEDRFGFEVPQAHYEQAVRAFDQGDYMAANGQYRSALDATYDVLAADKGCPATNTGGAARKWLAANGHLAPDESELLRAASGFAGAKGSHAGLSDAVDSQIRRHVITALIAWGIAKLG